MQEGPRPARRAFARLLAMGLVIAAGLVGALSLREGGLEFLIMSKRVSWEKTLKGRTFIPHEIQADLEGYTSVHRFRPGLLRHGPTVLRRKSTGLVWSKTLCRNGEVVRGTWWGIDGTVDIQTRLRDGETEEKLAPPWWWGERDQEAPPPR